ncbi:MBL fold metallo-hydrolase [Nocardioides jishulii]|uniref:MBL fold metallo-hydrolase n=1 Tax=Nocardioides jishulii TaxID=2575440 RepID=A0A4U2YTQ2_9ACTN|nr:MBL fold metallo-hydrolase [Nocardioides jishulii]QCX28673.1 MBL fold metallo-hydrolase [Nocardioides jishulii]TKI64434.1 MBL fold metallo-hydrolase [Nocardioides jishulii]
MRITKFGHACVRIEHEGTTLVLDPGGFTSPEAVEGADVVLITHEHGDHYAPDNLRRCDAQIYTIGGVADQIRSGAPDLVERLTEVAPGEEFTAGVPIKVVGVDHAVIHSEIPRIHNSGYLMDFSGTKVYHPGDALTAPGEPVDLLLTPSSAPWLKVGEAIDFVQEVGARHNLAIHDAIYSEAGHGFVDSLMGLVNEPKGLGWTRLAVGSDLPPL